MLNISVAPSPIQFVGILCIVLGGLYLFVKTVKWKGVAIVMGEKAPSWSAWVVLGLGVIIVTVSSIGGIIPSRSLAPRATATVTLKPAPTQAPYTLREYPINPNDANHRVTNLTAGPDGNVWFTDKGANAVGYITPRGVITEYPITGCQSCGLDDIVTGKDGNLWFTEYLGRKIGRVTPQGKIDEFDGGGTLSDPNKITLGPDGNVWFTDAGKLGRVTPDGTITEFPTNVSNSYTIGITAGPDGNIWFIDSNANSVGMLNLHNLSAPPREIALTNRKANPQLIAPGPDNTLWLTEEDTGYVDVVNVSNDIITPYYIHGGSPYGIVLGPNHEMWVTRAGAPDVASLNGNWTFDHQFSVRAPAQPQKIIVGPDQKLYFGEDNSDVIGVIAL